MPFFNEGQDPLDAQQGPAERMPMGAPETNPFAGPTSLVDAIPAAFRQQNPIASVLDTVGRSTDQTRDNAYNPLQILKGTRFEQDPSSFLEDPNEATTRAKMMKADRELTDQRTLAASGAWTGTVASLGAGLLDPSYYLPIMGEVRGAGAAINAGRLALGGLGQSAASEAILSDSQQQPRSWKESAGNIATNTLLMGILGGALGHLTAGERAEATEGLEAARRDATPVNPIDPASPSLQDHITPGPTGFSQGVERRAEELRQAIENSSNRDADLSGAEARIFYSKDGETVLRRPIYSNLSNPRPNILGVLQPFARDAETGAELLPRVLDRGGADEFHPDDLAKLYNTLADHGYVLTDDNAGNLGFYNGRLMVIDPGAIEPIGRFAQDANPANLEEIHRGFLDEYHKALNEQTNGQFDLKTKVKQYEDQLARSSNRRNLEHIEAAIIESLPSEIMHEVDGGAAQKSIIDAAERGGYGGEPDPQGALGETGSGLDTNGLDARGPAVTGSDVPVDAGTPGPATGDSGGVGVGNLGERYQEILDNARKMLNDPNATSGSKAEAQRVVDGYEEHRQWVRDFALMPDADKARFARRATNDLKRLFSPEENTIDLQAETIAGGGLGQSLSAASSDLRTLIPKSYGLDKIPLVGDWLNKLSPNLRVYFGPSVEAKRAVADLAETAIRFKQHDLGIPTASEGGPLETMVRQSNAVLMADAHDILEHAWQGHRYGESKPGVVQRTSDMVSDFRRQTPAGKLSYKDFKAAVYQAMYSGDASAIPEVVQAAKDIRARVFDRIAKMAQETLGPDGKPMLSTELSPPKGDQSFVPRMWNHEAVIQKRFQLKQIITNWLGGEQAAKAAAQIRLRDLQERHEQLGAQSDKLDKRLETLKRRSKDTSTRLDETSMSAGHAGKREDAMDARATVVKQSLSELEEFINEMRGQVSDPAGRERMAQLEKEVAQLRKEAKPMSQAEMDRIEKSETVSVLPNELRKAAEVAIGRRTLKKPQSLIDYLIKMGGIEDSGGDVRHMLGSTRARPGLLNKTGLGIDAIGERLHDEIPGLLERPSVNEVLDAIEGSLRGDDPWWFREHAEPPNSEAARVREASEHFSDLFDHLGESPRSLREVTELLRKHEGEVPGILDRLEQKASAGHDYEGALNTLDARKSALKELRDFIDRGRAERDRERINERVADARTREAGIASHRISGRQKLLQNRLDHQSAMNDLLNAAKKNAEEARADLRSKIEKEIRDWQGNSTGDAVAALNARDEAERVRTLKQDAGVYEGKGERLTSADGPVDRAVNRILRSDRDLSPQELQSRADQIIDRIIGSPDGRIPYDAPSGGPQIGYTGGPKQEVRGSLQSRDFAIPTDLVKDFVHQDMEHVVSSFLRTMLPDIALTRRFGDVDMTDVFRRIQEEYAAKIQGKTSEKQAKDLHTRRDADIRDVAALRDRLRGVYGWNPDPSARKLASIVRDFHGLTSIASLGTSVANRFNDIGAQATMRYGIQNVFNDAWRPFFKSMLGMSPLAGIAKQQAKEMGVGIDGLLGHLRHNLSDINDNYLPGNKFSRGISWANDRSMLLNLHGPWTDWMKAMAWVPAQAEFGRVADRIASGKGTAKDLAMMADANIQPHMAERISQQLGQHSTTVDGVRLATTGEWTDEAARDAFERAMAREANINVITAGHGDKPLFLSKPIGGLLGQFKSFVAGAHERILVSNLQQRDGRTLQGMLVAMTMGMLSYRMYTLLAGQEASPRPQNWIKEGLARSALTGWFNEGNTLLSKLTAGKLDYNRLYGANLPLTRRQAESPLADLLGPTYARLEGLSGAVTHTMSGHFGSKDIHELRQALPMQNLMGARILFDNAEDGVSNALGVKPRNRSPHEWPQ